MSAALKSPLATNNIASALLKSPTNSITKMYEINTTPDTVSRKFRPISSSTYPAEISTKTPTLPNINNKSRNQSIKSNNNSDISSQSSNNYLNDNQEFDYENYFGSNKKNKSERQLITPLQIKTPVPRVNQQEKPKNVEESLPKKVKQRSAVQVVNDLTHLLDHNEPNVHFKFGVNNSEVSIHSLVLLSRSAWFRRSWRMTNDSEHNSELLNDYDFSYRSSSRLEFERELEISMASNTPPSLSDNQFEFSVNLCNEQNEYEFLKAFKQFKLFLYRGDCNINKENLKHLIVLSEAFKVDSLKTYLSAHYQSILTFHDIDGLLYAIQLAHVYDLTDLKAVCIRLINENSSIVVNAASWKQLTKKYPLLVLQIFRKN